MLLKSLQVKLSCRLFMVKEERRLDSLKRAHNPTSGDAARRESVRIEDYIEIIHELINEYEQASPGDVADHLHVSKPTVSKMLQRLDLAGLVEYERYGREVTLTEGGLSLATMLRHRHSVISDFLRHLGINDEIIHADTEGIEHHLHPDTVERLSDLADFISSNPDWWDKFKLS